MMQEGRTEAWQDLLAQIAEYLYAVEYFREKVVIINLPQRCGKYEAREAVQELFAEYNELASTFGLYGGCSMEEFAREHDEEAFDREWNRERQREARPRERDRARARYKAHCIRMTAQKARQHLRRRKYRSGANAGVW